MKRILALSAAVGLAVVLAGCKEQSVESVQRGYRGLGMEQLYTKAQLDEKRAANVAPEPFPAVEKGGDPAGKAYENVQVLKDVSVAEFTRLMAAITTWVAPEEGCNYCHEEENLAADTKYTKIVSRRMLEMTQHINANAKNHVGETGVTCYTCHRGQHIPSQVWFTEPVPRSVLGAAGNKAGQNTPVPALGLASLPYDPLTPFLGQDNEIRVVSTQALPGTSRLSIKQTEWTYSLMMHMSEALDVNCTYCHNTQSFASWQTSSPQRVTAWHGIRLARDLNANFLEPLKPQFPAARRGPLGDVAKVSCATCHQGAFKPLLGANMLKDYPELSGKK